MNQHLKDIFNFMKKMGYYKEYKTYEDFQVRNFKGTELEKWKLTLSPEDRKRFEEMFENEKRE